MPTNSGGASVEYLAKVSGDHFYVIKNMFTTDAQKMTTESRLILWIID